MKGRKSALPFELQSLRRRKAAYIDVRNRIRRAAPMLGGQFTTHDYLHGRNGWIDAFFLGRKAPVFYNLTIETARHAFQEAVQDRAWRHSYELAPDREPLFVDAVVDPKSGCRTFGAREPVRYPELDGNTRAEWVQAHLQSVADSGDIEVFEAWELHRDYSVGIGLHATIDVPYITVDAVNGFIDRFRVTEANHRDPVPRAWRYEQLPHWGLEANAVLEPWEWADAEAKAGLAVPDR
ncbi:hypothetical protein HT746_15350 [Burkholderia pyrrocinia]|uniref:hypothetical protein n=1 Tax=Burkholderia pyrrocinia TaxID=60550 RepID=UPI001575E559|nr:hypothetical protein [Burkholderia pyrrocinia]NTX28490.1 hypothetical protein [Burkholderia pyrrocinia]QVN17534.1 hypothetical protein JYG32_14900 [Burkholderia pyrrocinia]